MQLKLCKYTVCVEDDNSLLLYSTLTGALLRIDEHDRMSAARRLMQSHRLDGSEDAEFVQVLTQQKFLIPSYIRDSDMARYLHQTAIGHSKTLSFLIYVTNACNFRCVYCPEEHTPETMTIETVDRLCSDIEKSLSSGEFQTLSLSWFGGEPLLNMPVISHAMLRLRSYCEVHGIELTGSATTNGYLLNEQNLTTLFALGVNRFQITVDGLSETHNQTRPLANGGATWGTIWSNLKAMSLRPEPFGVSLRINANRNNLESAKALIDLAARDLDSSRFQITINPISNMGGDPHCSEYCSIEDGQLIQFQLHDYLADHYPNVSNDLLTRIAPLGMICNSGRPNYYIVRTDGAISKCELNTTSEYSVLRDAGSSEELDKFLLSQYITPSTGECEDCVLYPLCFGLICPHKKVLGVPCTYKNDFLLGDHIRLLAKCLEQANKSE